MSKTGKQLKIVVVHEDQDIQEQITGYFTPLGFQVICFSNPNDAIRMATQQGILWDILLTDFQSKQMSGRDFAERIKQILPKLAIVLVTPPDLTEFTLEIVKKDAFDVVLRPINFLQLHVAINRAVHVSELRHDIIDLRHELKGKSLVRGAIVGRSPTFLKTLELAKRVARSNANIFITGESGTGKEVIARYIHSESKQTKGPFVAINCSSIPEHLLESELFGHAKGAFTGAHEKRLGLFEEAEDGTLFLDEIGDLCGTLQAKLLRVLQERQIRRVGENQYRAVNCRVISATHRDLSHEVKEFRFREDLLYRLDVIPIHIPPLRDRKEDILPLADAFLRRFALENGAPALSFSKDTIKYLLANPWQGNVRELENSIERAVVLCETAEIALKDILPPETRVKTAGANVADGSMFSISCGEELPTLDEVTRKYIEYAVTKKGGARDTTAKLLGIDRKTLYKKLKIDEKAQGKTQH